ncbi:zinc finger and BTB domain-containing protein 18.3-like [Malaya genurostris]|uniref:zinc finger and BTB domain-containing protein 18.3-like n=1 Tax=Malaya genurostris TaxID=325434 RepID=UPI0026F3C67B|nr:zinc finger and BTB domain-containing protein 18.3-like [Malaya genurostris]
MEHDEFSLEYFCRLCASEGVVIHPLFPPGDDDPKDELVRMIDVLTSVTLTRTQDSCAVICDKCLQMLDLFCQFREECLRQDVMIRTRRVLTKDRLEEERRLLIQQQLAERQQTVVEIKEEDPPEPPTIVIDDCKEEQQEEDDGDEEPQITAEAVLQSSLIASNSNFQSPAEISLYSQTSNLSISVQVNQISLNGTGSTNAASSAVISEPTGSEARPQKPVFRKGKLDPNKPPPDCDTCQESFSTHYDYEQHMDTVHAWDRGTRCSLACDPCQMRFTKSYNLKRHMYEVHGELAPGLTVTACEYCGVRFLRGYTLNRHIAKMHSKRKAKKAMLLKSK